MTNHFPEAFKRMPEKIKKVKTFDELKQSFKDYAGNKAPMTTKQVRALGVEAKKLGIENTSQQFRFMRNGKTQIRYRDVVTGRLTRSDGTVKSKK